MRARFVLAALLASGAANLTGCGTPAESAANGDVGSVGLALQVAPGITINTLSYTLSGPSPKTGTINVANSTTVSTVIGAVTAGTGYSISLSGTATDGTTTCSGMSGSFGVTAGMTTTVTVGIECHIARTTGSVLVNGTINVCPVIDAVSANPPVGNTIAIVSAAEDVDHGPSLISYQWTTSSGTLSSATVANPTLTCTAPGPVMLTLSISDGDPACSDSFNLTVNCPADSALNESAWVEIGANNQAIARLLTPYTVCPSITVDGTTSPMHLRVGPASEPLRTTSTDTTLMAAMTSGNSKPSIFTESVCEFNIPAGAHTAVAAGKTLPLPKATVNRVVVVGDTGCRISIGNVYQACGDPTIWPWSVVSSVAAAMQPDLVLHVGDYQYRDNPCPPGNTACTGTPWGYGSDTWYADLFTPAAPLLAAAPWIMVRGNHETCNRAGQGWYRYLDPYAYDTTDVKTCNNPANDNSGNYNDPWAVSIGDTNFVVFDSANAPKTTLAAGFQPYTSELTAAATLAPANLFNIWAVHHPVLGYSAANPPTSGNPGLQSIMQSLYGNNYYPPNIGVAMHGHVHDFQALNFSSNHPATFVAGNGGDNLDAALPTSGFDPNGDLPAANTAVSAFAFAQEFGFMVMDRIGAVGNKQWKFTSYRTNGTVIAICTLAPPLSSCSAANCDSTPGNQVSCTDANLNPIGIGTSIGVYDNIP
jgi:hypothetical protein